MSNGRYILDANNNPVEEPDLLTWANWFEGAVRRVAFTDLGWCWVSTFFLGLDYSFAQKGPPVLWQTMVFGGRFDQDMNRYSSRDDAIAGHYATVDQCRKARRAFYARLRRIRGKR